jgi:hypothetical protein
MGAGVRQNIQNNPFRQPSGTLILLLNDAYMRPGLYIGTILPIHVLHPLKIVSNISSHASWSPNCRWQMVGISCSVALQPAPDVSQRSSSSANGEFQMTQAALRERTGQLTVTATSHA